MAILQAYQADLLLDIDEGGEASAYTFRELCCATDLSLRASKEMAKSISWYMAALMATERYLWLNLSDMKEKSFYTLLSPHDLLSPQSLRGFRRLRNRRWRLSLANLMCLRLLSMSSLGPLKAPHIEHRKSSASLPVASHRKTGEPGKIYYKVLKERRPKVEFTVSSDINKTLLECNTWCKTEWDKEFRPRVELVSANVDLFDAINVFNTYDRKADASVTGTYVQRETYKHMEYKDEAGERLPRAGASVAAGVGRAHAEYSILEAEAKGPNVSAGVEISVAGLGAMAQAEVGSASAKAGPVSVKVGLGLDTGVSIGLTGVEAKFLGCGVSAGLKTSVSLLGSEVSCSVM
ncbi:uncharacterized protein LOC125266186 [Megalobrama amblycephala]|uniref:uncharacterized protein LOC125266186 n=1 Tax=Megalobrama amblycephala TaxID=75352 RepID=UPI002013C9AC|nr:uncharacterized protein LOC125266186 [Megalobrama amblycephala]